MNPAAPYRHPAMPLLQIAGGSREERVRVCRELLPLLERESISSLLLFRDHHGIVSELPAACHAFVKDCFCTTAHAGYSAQELFQICRKFKDEYDLILYDDNAGTGPLVTLLDPLDPHGKPLCTCSTGGDGSLWLERILTWLERKNRQIPTWGCLLIGGLSSRMGRPKHLLTDSKGRTWAEMLAAKLGSVTEKVVLCGRGDVPDSLASLARLTDIVGAQGPLAGILAALRWNPDVSWLVCACDMPQIDRAALQWLLEMRRAGVWGTVPYFPQSKRLEPLLAHYDPRSRNLFETMLAKGKMRISEIGNFAKIETVEVVPDLAASWRNCNTPDDLANLP